MKFGIKDLLLATGVAALVALSVRGAINVRYSAEELQHMQAQLQVSTQKLRTQRLATGNREARLDFFREIERLHTPILRGLAQLQETYGKIEPKNGKVSLRRVPAARSSVEESVWFYRVGVPNEFPVYLRSGVAVQDSLTSKDKSRLDELRWIMNSPLVDSETKQIELLPGVHDVIIRRWNPVNEKGLMKVRIEVDSASVFETDALEPRYRSGGSGSIAPRQQYDFEFRNYPKQLVRFDMNDSDGKQDYEYWIWLSGKQVEGKFTDLPQQETGR